MQEVAGSYGWSLESNGIQVYSLARTGGPVPGEEPPLACVRVFWHMRPEGVSGP